MLSAQILRLTIQARTSAYNLIGDINYDGYCTNGTEGRTWNLRPYISKDLRELSKIVPILKQNSTFKRINNHKNLPITTYTKQYKKALDKDKLQLIKRAKQLYHNLAIDSQKVARKYFHKSRTDMTKQIIHDLKVTKKIAKEHAREDIAYLKDPKRHNRKEWCIVIGSHSGKDRRNDYHKAKHYLNTQVNADLTWFGMLDTINQDLQVYFEARNNQEVRDELSTDIDDIKSNFTVNKSKTPKEMKNDLNSSKSKPSSNNNAPVNSLGLQYCSSWIMISRMPDHIVYNGKKYKTLNNQEYQQVK